MASGRLDAGGVGALRALKHLMTAKAVDYDFQYYVLPQPADAPVTVGLPHWPSMAEDQGLSCSCCVQHDAGCVRLHKLKVDCRCGELCLKPPSMLRCCVTRPSA